MSKKSKASKGAVLTPPHCVAKQLYQTARMVARVFSAELAEVGVSLSQFSTLNRIADQGPITITELAEQMVMDRTTVTRNLRALTTPGWVKVVPNPQDRRSKLLSITTAGIRCLRDARGPWERAQAQVLQAYGRANWRALEDDLQQLRDVTSR